MFNVSIKLREPEGLITPKGPNFNRARTITSNIEGTEICFKAPKHNPRYPNHKGYLPEKYYGAGMGFLHFRSYYDKESEARGLVDHWREADFFYHTWKFCGPWFTGVLSELRLNFRVVNLVDYPGDASLFHPRVLEQVVGDYLTYVYSRHLDSSRKGIQKYIGPVNWTPLSHLPVNAARCDVVSQEYYPNSTVDHLVFIPVSSSRMLSLVFAASRFKALPLSELDKRVSMEPMRELMDNIVNSIQINLSAEAELQQKSALEGLKDTSLTKEYPPLKWDKLSAEEAAKILIREY